MLSDILMCITYNSTKLGPRLVRTAEEWGLTCFSKENLYIIIHDSIIMRTPRSTIYTETLDGTPYRVLICKQDRRIVDYRYQADSYSYCFFFPQAIFHQFRIDSTINNLDWINVLKEAENWPAVLAELEKKISILPIK